MTEVILVDETDNEIGTMEKLTAHQVAVLHRAISVFLFNDKDEILLQRRASDKYHSGGLWTNTCCSHPYPGEATQAAAYRRLKEEMGVICDLEPVFNFIYKANLDHDLIEHELDHVFIGRFNGIPKPNTDEVMDWKYMAIDDLQIDVEVHPEKYTAWFKICLNQVLTNLTRI